MPKQVPADEPVQSSGFESFYTLRTPDDEPEPVVVIEPFPTTIPDPPAAKTAHNKPQEG